MVKLGTETRYHDLTNEWYVLQFSDIDYRPIIPPVSSRFYQKYHYKPKEFSAYAQDKIEFKDLIINVGLRYDFFHSNGKILSDPSDPQIYDPFNPYHKYKDFDPEKPLEEQVEYTVEEREKFWYKKASPKYQLSPRFGLAFPITDKGVIHFSYGHFFQNPAFQYLYENPNFWIIGAGANNWIGNADLNAERTVMYEIGLQQQLWYNFYVNVTSFYRDIRDWVGISTPIDTYNSQTTYFKYVNKDHATAQGITLSGRYTTSHISIDLDYTYMIAKGTTSDPLDAYYDALAKRAPRVQLVNLDWDQRHTLNAVTSYQFHSWAGSIIGSIHSGLPYTPSFARGEVSGKGTFTGLRENSEFKPYTYNIDLKLSKNFSWSNLNFAFVINVFNLLDTRNAINIYPDTGRPDYTLEGISQEDRNPNGVDIEISDVREFFSRPGNYSASRFIQLAISINF
jgi:hypothetical protein